MRPNSRELAMRDGALAAALGIVGAPGATYGAEPTFGSEWGGSDMGWDETYYGYHGDGFGFGADAVAPAAAMVARSDARHPLHPAQAMRTQAIVASHNQKQQHTTRRELLLRPNKGSDIDVERYDFSVPISSNLVLGTATTIGTSPSMSIQPSVTVRPQRGCFNAPSVGFVTVTTIQSANVNGLVGGATDAGIYGPGSFGVHLDLPTLSPANKLTITGGSTTLVPPGFPIAFSFPFVASFQGPATIVA